MKSPLFRNLFVLVPLAAGLCLAGCEKDEDLETPTTRVAPIKGKPQQKPRVKLSFKPSAKQRKLMGQIERQAKPNKPRFSSAEFKKANAPLFTYIVATRGRGYVQQAGLKAMVQVYGTRPDQAAFDNDYVAVVTETMTSSNTDVQELAIAAAGHALSAPNADPSLVTNLLAKIEAQNTPAMKYNVLLALDGALPEARTEGVMKLLTSALDDSNPLLVSAALRALKDSGSAVKEPAALMKRVVALSTHEDPGVRGRAIELAASLAAPVASDTGANAKPAARAAGLQADALRVALTGLHDKNGFVRAASCSALATIGNKAAIHPLVALVDDQQSSHYNLPGLKGISDEDEQLLHQVSDVDAVSDAALTAINQLSGDKVTLAPVPVKNSTDALVQNAAATKAWYAEAKATLPKASVLPAVKLPKTSGDAPAAEAAKAPKAAAVPAGAQPAAATPAAVQPAAGK